MAGDNLIAAVLPWPDDGRLGHALVLHTGDHCIHFFVIADLEGMVLEGVELGQLQVDDLFVTAPDLCPDRLRQSGFSIFHWPFAIPPSWFSGMKKGLDLSCQAPVVGLPPFPAPMKKPPFVVKERFFSRLAVHYFVFLYVSLCTLLQKSVIITETRILSCKTHIQTWKLPVLSRKQDGSFRDNIRVSVIV